MLFRSGVFITPAHFDVPTQNLMSNRRVISIETYCRRDVSVDPNNPLIATLDNLNFSRAFLTILRQQDNGVEAGDFYKNVPLPHMRRAFNPGVAVATAPEKWTMAPATISWVDSYINVPTTYTAATVPNTTYAVCLLVTYLLKDQDPATFPNVPVKHR